MKVKNIVCVIVTIVFLVATVCLDIISNDNSSKGEAMLKWEFTVVPILMFLHGALFAFCLDKKRRLPYVALSVVAVFILFFIMRVFMNVGLKDSALAATSAVVLSGPLLCIGLLIGIGISYAYRGIKKNGKLLEYRYRK